MFNIAIIFLGFGLAFLGVYLMKIAIYLWQSEPVYLPKRYGLVVDLRTGHLKHYRE